MQTSFVGQFVFKLIHAIRLRVAIAPPNATRAGFQPLHSLAKFGIKLPRI